MQNRFKNGISSYVQLLTNFTPYSCSIDNVMAGDNGIAESFSRVTTDAIFNVETEGSIYRWTLKIIDFGIHGFEIRFPLHSRKSFAPKKTKNLRLPHPWFEFGFPQVLFSTFFLCGRHPGLSIYISKSGMRVRVNTTTPYQQRKFEDMFNKPENSDKDLASIEAQMLEVVGEHGKKNIH